MRVLLCLVAFLTLPLTAWAGRGPDPAHGLWLTANERAIVAIEPCGDETCGRMVWVAEPVDKQGALKRDRRNPDRTKRSRSLCGLNLVGGLSQEDVGRWGTGWLYNPRDGSTYSARLRALSPDRLEVRGYLGVPLLGGSQVWTRVHDDRGGCPG